MTDDPRTTAPTQRVQNLARLLDKGLFASHYDRLRGHDNVLLAYAQGARWAIEWMMHRCDDAILLDCLAAEANKLDDVCRRIVTTKETDNDHPR